MFLDGLYPSSINRHTRLLNQNLSACIDFSNNSSVTLCHQINESDIPNINDSILDAGFFVVSDKLNETAAEACISIGYHNWGVFCNGETIDTNSFYSNAKYFAQVGPTYDDVSVNDACLNYHHLKEGTPEFHDCERALS